jgi:hypothetical protein
VACSSATTRPCCRDINFVDLGANLLPGERDLRCNLTSFPVWQYNRLVYTELWGRHAYDLVAFVLMDWAEVHTIRVSEGLAYEGLCAQL